MKKFIAIYVCCFCIITAAQATDSTSIRTVKSKHPNISIQTMDGLTYRGRVVQLGTNFVLMEALPYNDAAALNQYYLRREGDYCRVDVDYLKSATISRGRSIGMSTLIGTLAGGILMGGIGYYTGIHGAHYDPLTGMAYGIVAGVGIGTTAGFISGLFHHKKFRIDGSTTQMVRLQNYYF
ncbi:hypothetical protein BH10BAC3_BH10BAC3_29160 [soil metagenome]